MRAVSMTAAGGPEVLKVTAVPEPELTGEHDIRVRAESATSRCRSPGWLEPPRSRPTRRPSWRRRSAHREPVGGRGDQRHAQLLHLDAAPSVFGWPQPRERQRAILEQAAAHFDASELRIAVGATFPLYKAANAQRPVETGQVVGKTVLTMP
jgi:NADPH:quinone reductase-like Zn-dependent oxidoreductase